jgi:hypothetical protein
MFSVSANGSDLANMIRETFKDFEKGIESRNPGLTVTVILSEAGQGTLEGFPTPVIKVYMSGIFHPAN